MEIYAEQLVDHRNLSSRQSLNTLNNLQFQLPWKGSDHIPASFLSSIPAGFMMEAWRLFIFPESDDRPKYCCRWRFLGKQVRDLWLKAIPAPESELQQSTFDKHTFTMAILDVGWPSLGKDVHRVLLTRIIYLAQDWAKGTKRISLLKTRTCALLRNALCETFITERI